MNENNLPVITKKALTCYSLEVCEFCEKTFENRYDSLIHNATHIIIPLLKQDFLKCNKCSYYCTSQNDLHQHIFIAHPLVIKTVRLNFWDDSVVDKSKEETREIEALDRDIQKQIEKNVKFIEKNGVSGSKKDGTSIENYDVKPKVKTENGEYDETILTKTSVVDRLRFENEDILEQLLNANSNENLYKPNIINGTSTYVPQCCNGESQKLETTADSTLDQNDIPLIYFSKYEANTDSNEFSYHTLNKPHWSMCRYCSAIFPSRLDLIIHEKKHMRFAQTISGLLCLHCDKYIAGTHANLSKHINAKHYRDKYKVHCTNVCKKCGLQYRSYKHHMYNYHSSKCCDINKFVTDNHFKNHLDKCLCHSHVLSVCRLCYNVLRGDNMFKCVTLGIKRTRGVLQDCKKCDYKVNEIISVKLRCKIRPKYHYWYVQNRPLSNEDRLQNIRMRLKKLNLISKM